MESPEPTSGKPADLDAYLDTLDVAGLNHVLTGFKEILQLRNQMEGAGISKEVISQQLGERSAIEAKIADLEMRIAQSKLAQKSSPPPAD